MSASAQEMAAAGTTGGKFAICLPTSGTRHARRAASTPTADTGHLPKILSLGVDSDPAASRLKADAALKATEQPIDTSTAAGKYFLDKLGVFVEFETNLRRECQLERDRQGEGRRRLHGPHADHRSGRRSR
jgi:hypothetical protein